MSDWEHLWLAFVSSLILGLLGIALAVIGFKVFDWITPRMDIEKELAEKNNVAVAIVVAAILLGVAYIVGVAIH
jgi:putative membrane protein